jgi:hypothetical protein
MQAPEGAAVGFELQPDPRLRILGAAMVLAGVAVTVQFYRTLPEAPVAYILAYVPPAALLALGGILAFSGVSERLFD